MKTKTRFLHYFLLLIEFAVQEALSCLFPLLIFATLAISKLVSIPYLPRYDFIFIVCLLIQITFIMTKFETKKEFLMICIFHLIGLILEIFKVRMGSWSYPEQSYLKIMDVPIYSGFMYASVGSYICQAWKRMHIQLINYPNPIVVLFFGSLIYLNFFTHHYFYDLRWLFILILPFVFFKTTVQFKVKLTILRMHLVLSFFLIGLFIWIAENIATFFGAWKYPDQHAHWQIVHVGKISSWFLLVIVSFIIVAFSQKDAYNQTHEVSSSR